MLRGLFTLFLTLLFRLSCLQNENRLVHNIRSLSLFRAFLDRIKADKNPRKTMVEYAGELAISPVHLNRVCQAVARKSAVRVVQVYFMAEAQRYLSHTSFSVSEVAYALNFDDPAYFSRLFRKHTGVSPKLFRERANASPSAPG